MLALISNIKQRYIVFTYNICQNNPNKNNSNNSDNNNDTDSDNDN